MLRIAEEMQHVSHLMGTSPKDHDFSNYLDNSLEC